MQRVAQDWLVLELSGGSALAVGITTGLQFLPMLLLSPYAGVIADRFNKRQILKITQSWLALCAAALGVLAVAGVATTEQVYLIAFAFGLGTAFDHPRDRASCPRWLVLTISRTRSGSTRPLSSARIVGPALAGLVIARLDRAGRFCLTRCRGLHCRLVDHRRSDASCRCRPVHEPSGSSARVWRTSAATRTFCSFCA